MTDDDTLLYEAWDRTYDQVQFWVGVHEKALLVAQGNADDPAVRFARAKRDQAEAEHHDVVKRLEPPSGK
ncbi:MAG: hypothetical protein AAGF48_01075 [Pseudomonadota bacterium]